jgi:hypothetical protein
MKLLREFVEDVEFLVENSVAGKKFYIEGPFLSYDTPNKNNRVYSESIMRPAVEKYITEYINPKRAMGELGHPQNPTIGLERVSHMIESMSFRPTTKHVTGKALVLETPMGMIARNLMEAGAKLGVSSRGLGSVRMIEGISQVQNDFTINTVDIVGDPSGHGCWVDALQESADWKLVNGQWVEAVSEVLVDMHKKRIDESIALQEFSRLMEVLKAKY